MFCPNCGKSIIPNAKYCHGCGKSVNQANSDTTNRVGKQEALGWRSDGDINSTSPSTSSSRSSTRPTNARPATFSEFCSRKESDRSKHFNKKKDGKRLKLHDKPGKSIEVKVNIGIMTKRDDALVVKRGVTLPVTVRTHINYDELIQKAVEKHHRFNKDIIKHDDKKFYYLLYSDKKKADTLPGCDEAFTLKRYKEEIDKPYSRITFFLCSRSDYVASIFNDLFDSDSDSEVDTAINSMDEESPEKLPVGLIASPPVVVQLDDEPESSIQAQVAQQPQSSTSKEAQCPLCFLMFPIEHIQEHADTCSPWAMESEQSADLSECGISAEIEESAEQVEELDMSQYKSLLKKKIAECATRLSTNVKRINVRRRFLWEDFKAARKSRIGPLSNLKVVFVGEPSIDDGGPKRELFSGKF